MDGSNVPAPQARRFAANMRAIAGAMGRACIASERASMRVLHACVRACVYCVRASNRACSPRWAGLRVPAGDA